MIGDFIARVLEVRGDQRGCLFFLRREFGMLVEMFVGCEQ
jgi:hypothetical protein